MSPPMLAHHLRTVLTTSSRSAAVPRRMLATGARGSRGHGWYSNYRAGKGGRHLQGEYYAHETVDQQIAWNEAVLALGSTTVEMQVKVVPKGALGDSSATQERDATIAEPLAVHKVSVRLASTVMPESSFNFIELARHKYRDTLLYRVERAVGFCGGDVLTNTGRSGMPAKAAWDASLARESSNTLFQPNPLSLAIRQDPLALWHIPGTLSMLVSTVGEVDSRFLLLHEAAPHMNGIHRAIGVMTDDSRMELKQLHDSTLTRNGVPLNVDLVVGDCQVLEADNGQRIVTVDGKATDASAQATAVQ